MNALSKALDEIKYRIPLPLLEEAFNTPTFSWRSSSPISLDESIKNKVIRPRVLIDAKITGGVETLIPLFGIVPDIVNNYIYVFHIPKSLTGGRSILSALSISYISPAVHSSTLAGTMAPCSVNDTLTAADAVMNSFSSVPPVNTAQVRLIAENTIEVIDNFFVINNAYLRCKLEPDEQMSHLSIYAFHDFAKLVELAVKSYIYNVLVIRIDTARLDGGMDLGSFRSILESYSDAEQMYQDFLRERWVGVESLNDHVTKTRVLRAMIGSMK